MKFLISLYIYKYIWKFAKNRWKEDKILVGKLQAKRLLGRSRCGWVDNIKMDLRYMEWDGINWIDLAQDNGQWKDLVNMVMKLQFP
jgi:hypothetical protein